MITQGYLARHFQDRSGMANPALLDVAQDYALKHLHDQGAFELGIVLKGRHLAAEAVRTNIRKIA